MNDGAITPPLGEKTGFHTTEEDTTFPSGEETIIILTLTTQDVPLSSINFDFIDTVRPITMAPASNEEQFKFLISCIRHSNNGKVSSHLSILTHLYNADCHQVDFTEVAKECNIVSKGAA